MGDSMESENERGHWLHKRNLGAGAFGVVELWENDYTKKTIAIKRHKGGIRISEKQRERWIKEVEIMNSLSHSNIVATLSVPAQLCKLQDTLSVLCMEYCSGGDLRTVLNESSNCCGVEEPEALRIMQDVASAVEYLHSHELTHRDLKPENIVLQRAKHKIIYKLTDLGYVRELGQMSIDGSIVGTLNYLAPELFCSSTYTCSVDYWSLGILFYEVITGHRPFLPDIPFSPKWVEHVKKKRDVDICARNERGNVFFSTNIEGLTTISECMRDPLTYWFRLALQWDPKRRGKNINAQGGDELVVFSHLKSILSCKILYVFAVSIYRVDSYAVDPGISVQELQTAISKKTNIEVSHQIITDLKSNILSDPASLVFNCTKDSYLIVFQNACPRVEHPMPKKSPWHYRILNDPHATLDRAIERRRNCAVLFFVKQELELFRLYVIALSIKIDLSNISLDNLRENVKTLKSKLKSLMNELTKFAQSVDYIITTNELKCSLDTTKSKTQSLLNGTDEVTSKLIGLSEDFEHLRTFCETNWLKKWTTLYEQAKGHLDGNMRRPLDMVKLFCQSLQVRGTQLQRQEIVSVVSAIEEFDRNIIQLQTALNSFDALVDQCHENYEDIMRKQSIEQHNSCSDILIRDSILMRNVLESLGVSYRSTEDMEDLDFNLFNDLK